MRAEAAADATDAELLAAHVAGDPDAFGELVRRHQGRMWAVALRTLGDREEAADALQDAFLSAYRRAATYRGESAVTTWLHRVVVNACLDRVRRRAVRPTVPLPDDDVGLPRTPDATEAWDLTDALSVALATLPDEQRLAIVLVDLEGYPVSEAAQLLGVAVGTVKSRCSRGRLRLREVLAPTFAAGNHRPPAAVPPTPAPAPLPTEGPST